MTRHVVFFILCACLLAAAAPGALVAQPYSMKDGDTLYALAQEHYGDPSYWRELKRYNGISNVYAIPVGTEITFPDKASLDQIRQTGSTPGGDVAGTVSSLGGKEQPKTTFRSEALGGREVSLDWMTALGSPGTVPEGMSNQ